MPRAEPGLHGKAKKALYVIILTLFFVDRRRWPLKLLLYGWMDERRKKWKLLLLTTHGLGCNGCRKGSYAGDHSCSLNNNATRPDEKPGQLTDAIAFLKSGSSSLKRKEQNTMKCYVCAGENLMISTSCSIFFFFYPVQLRKVLHYVLSKRSERKKNSGLQTNQRTKGN